MAGKPEAMVKVMSCCMESILIKHQFGVKRSLDERLKRPQLKMSTAAVDFFRWEDRHYDDMRVGESLCKSRIMRFRLARPSLARFFGPPVLRALEDVHLRPRWCLRSLPPLLLCPGLPQLP